MVSFVSRWTSKNRANRLACSASVSSGPSVASGTGGALGFSPRCWRSISRICALNASIDSTPDVAEGLVCVPSSCIQAGTPEPFCSSWAGRRQPRSSSSGRRIPRCRGAPGAGTKPEGLNVAERRSVPSSDGPRRAWPARPDSRRGKDASCVSLRPSRDRDCDIEDAGI